MSSTTPNNFISIFQEISLEKPSDKIIQQIRNLISSGQLKPGDKLPPERKMVEMFGVGRGHVRDAIRKLEFYGILKTIPQSGTVVAGIGITALEGLISDVLRLENSDFASLVDTRILLETHSARLAAKQRNEEDIEAIQKALEAYSTSAMNGSQSVEEDLMFHLKIAEASKNAVLKSLMLIITPDIINSFNKMEVCNKNQIQKASGEHQTILTHIINQEPELAAAAMYAHLQDVKEFSKTFIEK